MEDCLKIQDALARAQATRERAHEHGLDLIVAELRLCVTLCRTAAVRTSAPRRREVEIRSRKVLGMAQSQVARLELTEEESRRFTKAFRELADLLPVKPFATVTAIDSARVA